MTHRERKKMRISNKYSYICIYSQIYVCRRHWKAERDTEIFESNICFKIRYPIMIIFSI